MTVEERRLMAWNAASKAAAPFALAMCAVPLVALYVAQEGPAWCRIGRDTPGAAPCLFFAAVFAFTLLAWATIQAYCVVYNAVFAASASLPLGHTKQFLDEVGQWSN